MYDSGESTIDRDGAGARDDRVAAIVGFLSAGIEPAPSKATMVFLLTDARQTVARLADRPDDLSAWLASQITRSGVPENAAIVVAVENASQPQPTRLRRRTSGATRTGAKRLTPCAPS